MRGLARPSYASLARLRRTGVRVLLLIALWLAWWAPAGHGSALDAGAAPPERQENVAPRLPAAGGRVVHVATSDALRAAVAGAGSATTVLIAPGRYRLTSPLAMANARDLAIRGETGRAGDVVIEGPGLESPAGNTLMDGIWTSNVRGLVLADVTIRNLPRHCAIFTAGTADPLIHNVHFVDCGQQNIKANPDQEGRGVPGGIVEYSRFEYTTTSRGSYTNAISGIGAIGWVVRHNVFRNIRAPRGQTAGPALLLRASARDTIVDSNTFIECQRGVSFGMSEDVPDDHRGGAIRNNFFFRSRDQPGDTAFSLWNARGARVIHNTALVSGTYHAAIDYRWAETSDLVIANNLLDAEIWQRRDASAATTDNVFGARAEWFRDATAGDLHLTPAATAALGRAAMIPGAGAGVDWDGDPRPRTGAEGGADQHR